MAVGEVFKVRTNIGALSALNALKSQNANLARTQLKLSTGRDLNESSDNPANFTLADFLHARRRGLAKAADNVAIARNVLQIAEGGLVGIHELLQRMKELTIQAANDALGSVERGAIGKELVQLGTEIDDIVEETTFTGESLLNGGYVNKSFQIGEDTTSTLKFSLAIDHTRAGLGVTVVDVADPVLTATGASLAQGRIDNAKELVLSSLLKLGSTINRLNFQEQTLNVSIVNTLATTSRLRDADIAREQIRSIRLQLLRATGTNQLAQANLAPGSVLALFQ